MKLKVISFLTLICLISALVLPATVLAAPITGADMDITKLFFDNGGFTDDTTDANNATVDDVDWPATGGTTIYFGGSSVFNEIFFYVSAENRSSAWDIATAGNFGAFEYYDGASWTSLTVVNDTGAWNATGIHTFSLTAPGDWTSTTVNGADNYYLRVSCDMACNQMIGSFDIDQISLGTGVGGGASPVPEFSTYVLFFTLCLAGFVTFKKTQANGLGRA